MFGGLNGSQTRFQFFHNGRHIQQFGKIEQRIQFVRTQGNYRYREKYSALPKKIIIYRGGVGDGDIKYVRDVEVANLEQKLKGMYEKEGQKLEMAFMIVTKKINARIFEEDRNPICGTVVDSCITLDER